MPFSPLQENSSIEDIKRLFDKTQRNISRIQQLGGEFYYPVLNEWRYVAEDAILALYSSKKRQETLHRLKEKIWKAYCDSCLILADCCLEWLIFRISRIKKAAKLKRSLQDVLEIATMEGRRLQRIRLDLEAEVTPSEEQMSELIGVIAGLRPVFDAIREKEDTVSWILRRRQVVMNISIFVTLVEVVAVTAFLFFRFWR